MAGFRPAEIRLMDVWKARSLVQKAVRLHNPFAGPDERPREKRGCEEHIEVEETPTGRRTTTRTTYRAIP